MNKWYSHFYNQPNVFKSGEGGTKSYEYRKHFVKGHVKWLGVASKCSRTYAKKEKINQSFVRFMDQMGSPIPFGYRKAELGLDAAFKSAAKYDKGEPVLNEVLWRQACGMTEKTYRIMGDSEVLTKEEVLTEIDKTTSCGFPGNNEHKDKNEFLNSSSEPILDAYFHLAGTENPDQIVAIWKVAQKDEMLPNEKVDAGKVRTFTAAPIEFSVLANRLFLHQNNKMNRNNITVNPYTTSFVGASKYAGGWHKTYNHISRNGKFMYAWELDESSYDASVFKRALMWLRDFRWKCLKPEYQTVENRRRVTHVYCSITNSIMVMETGEVIQKTTGNPSGSTNTINDNTLVLDVLFCYAWLVLCDRRGIETSYEHFKANVAYVLNGDDNTYATSETAKWFTPALISSVWTPLGVVTKTPCEEARLPQECSFLSQSFHWDEYSKKYYPKPEGIKVLCSLLCAAKCDDVRWHYLRACALRIESFWNLTIRDTIKSYILFLEEYYQDFLCGEIRGLTMDQIRGVWMTDDQIYALYSGKESSPLNQYSNKLFLAWVRDLCEDGIEPNPGPGKLNRTCGEVAPLKKEFILVIWYMVSKAKKRAARAAGLKIPKSIVAKKGVQFKKKLRVEYSGRRKGIHYPGSPVYENKRMPSRPPPPVPMRSKNLGDSIGEGVGGLVGKGLNLAWNWITGSGAYHINRNSMASGRPPLFSSRMSGDGSLEFAHSEFLQDVTGSEAFHLQNFLINPGLFATFPFLSTMAAQFEEYDLKGLVFQFRSTSGDALNSTNTALGTVIMSTEYDVLDMNFQSKQQMDAYMFTTSCNPSVSMIHPVECAPRKNVLGQQYVRTSAYPTGADPRFYDLGNFQIATEGMQGEFTIGELWVSYHVMLKKPKLPSELGSKVIATHMHEMPLGTATSSQPFGTANSSANRIYPGSTYEPPQVDDDDFVLQYPGRYFIAINWLSDTTMTATSSISIGVNLSGVGWFNDQTTYNESYIDTIGACHNIVVDVLVGGQGSANEIAVVGPTGLTGGICSITITQIPSGMTMSQRRADTRQANFLDNLINRLDRLELANKKMKVLRNDSLTDDDWKCDITDCSGIGCCHDKGFCDSRSGKTTLPSSSSKSLPAPGKQPGALPDLSKTLKEASLSDSVVDLIAAKLRK